MYEKEKEKIVLFFSFSGSRRLMGRRRDGEERKQGEVLILLGRKLGQLTPRSTTVAFKRTVG